MTLDITQILPVEVLNLIYEYSKFNLPLFLCSKKLYNIYNKLYLYSLPRPSISYLTFLGVNIDYIKFKNRNIKKYILLGELVKEYYNNPSQFDNDYLSTRCEQINYHLSDIYKFLYYFDDVSLIENFNKNNGKKDISFDCVVKYNALNLYCSAHNINIDNYLLNKRLKLFLICNQNNTYICYRILLLIFGSYKINYYVRDLKLYILTFNVKEIKEFIDVLKAPFRLVDFSRFIKEKDIKYVYNLIDLLLRKNLNPTEFVCSIEDFQEQAKIVNGTTFKYTLSNYSYMSTIVKLYFMEHFLVIPEVYSLAINMVKHEIDNPGPFKWDKYVSYKRKKQLLINWVLEIFNCLNADDDLKIKLLEIHDNIYNNKDTKLSSKIVAKLNKNEYIKDNLAIYLENYGDSIDNLILFHSNLKVSDFHMISQYYKLDLSSIFTFKSDIFKYIVNKYNEKIWKDLSDCDCLESLLNMQYAKNKLLFLIKTTYESKHVIKFEPNDLEEIIKKLFGYKPELIKYIYHKKKNIVIDFYENITSWLSIKLTENEFIQYFQLADKYDLDIDIIKFQEFIINNMDLSKFNSVKVMLKISVIYKKFDDYSIINRSCERNNEIYEYRYISDEELMFFNNKKLISFLKFSCNRITILNKLFVDRVNEIILILFEDPSSELCKCLNKLDIDDIILNKNCVFMECVVKLKEPDDIIYYLSSCGKFHILSVVLKYYLEMKQKYIP